MLQSLLKIYKSEKSQIYKSEKIKTGNEYDVAIKSLENVQKAHIAFQKKVIVTVQKSKHHYFYELISCYSKSIFFHSGLGEKKVSGSVMI